jgi:peptidoglycan/LPS O-acetylase OafA/YrhL
MSSKLHYRPEIDGLRTIAVLAVIAFHLQNSLLPGGYLGVDVFFVISGFLITSIIIREKTGGLNFLGKFWERRIKRILPAATFVLLFVSLVQSALIYKPDLLQQTGQKLSALLSFANIYFWINTGDYWGNIASESPYLHYWSLSIEEQYYLFFPLIVLALSGKRRKFLLPVVAILTVISFAAFAYSLTHHPQAAFYLLPTRVWQLGAGCLLAIIPTNNVPSNRAPATAAGVLLIVAAYFFPGGHSGLGYQSIIVVVGACLIIWSGSNRVSQIILENRATIFIGKISFSLYLWHWPIIVILKSMQKYNVINSNLALVVLGGIILIALSLFSYYFIENTFRKHTHGTWIALGFAIVVGIYFFAIEPASFRKPYLSRYAPPSWHGKYYDLKPRGELTETLDIIASSIHAPKREASGTAYKEGGIIRQRATPTSRVVLIGDSHAVMWSKLVDDITGELDLTTSLWSMNGESGLIHKTPRKKIGPYLTRAERYEYDSLRKDLIKKWNPDLVIVSNFWGIIRDTSATELFDFLQSHAKNVVIVESPPVLEGIGNRSVYQYLSFLGRDTSIDANTTQLWNQVNMEEILKARAKLLKIVYARPNFHFLPVADLFLLHGSATITAGNQVLYLDDDHLTNEGAKLASSRFKSCIENILLGKRNTFPIVSDNGPNGRRILQETAPQAL